jgi:hypothetical protein
LKAAKYFVFRVSEEHLRLSEVHVLADGTVLTEANIRLPAHDFVELVTNGSYTTEVSAGTSVVIPLLGVVRIASVESWRITSTEFAKEVADASAYLTGNATSLDTFHETFHSLLVHPTPEAQHRVRAALTGVPQHLRRFLLGDMDRKDSAVDSLLSSADLTRDVEVALRDPHVSRFLSSLSRRDINASIEARVVDVDV